MLPVAALGTHRVADGANAAGGCRAVHGTAEGAPPESKRRWWKPARSPGSAGGPVQFWLHNIKQEEGWATSSKGEKTGFCLHEQHPFVGGICLKQPYGQRALNSELLFHRVTEVPEPEGNSGWRGLEVPRTPSRSEQGDFHPAPTYSGSRPVGLCSSSFRKAHSQFYAHNAQQGCSDVCPQPTAKYRSTSDSQCWISVVLLPDFFQARIFWKAEMMIIKMSFHSHVLLLDSCVMYEEDIRRYYGSCPKGRVSGHRGDSSITPLSSQDSKDNRWQDKINQSLLNTSCCRWPQYIVSYLTHISYCNRNCNSMMISKRLYSSKYLGG